MIISWNVRGLNNVGKLKEIGSRLLELRPTITILIETRVKQVKARNIRNKLRLQGEFLDNYSSHSNGRIWLNWDTNKVTIKYIRETSQLLHCGVYDLTGNFLYWITAIYALNKLDQRRTLWTDIECIHGNQHGPWVLLGDFNNVLKAKDRVGGNLVTESEYEDLAKMMRNTGTFEKDSTGDYYTWSNKQTDGMIYSRIDRVLGNVEWFQDNMDTMLQILPPSVSEHALLCLADPGNTAGRQFHFKFSNCLTDLEEYHSTVSNSWNEPLNGRPMYVLWEKLKRLKPALNKINRPLHHIQSRIMEARQNLQHAQQSLVEDRWNSSKIDTVKRYTEEVINWNSLEEKTLQQKSKIDWLRLGDGNNSYFHATIKAKKSSKRLNLLHKDDGTVITSHDEIQDEVLNFYEGLMGTKDGNVRHINIMAMRGGPQLSMEQREQLVAPITDQEIRKALNGIGDTKSPGIDGFGAKFFKTSWNIIGKDVVAAVRDFFENDRIYKAFNCTLVTLIPKNEEAKTIKEYRPIAGCTTVYKIISKIITARMGRVMDSIVGKNQAAFVPGQKIHNHILLAYELIKGYSRKGGTPRCMMQIDLQKAYDMVNWDALECILKEIGVPQQFIRWIMIAVTTVSYRFNVNGCHSNLLQAKRGLRQGDPMSPLLFVIVMEYLNRILYDMQKNPNFNHHAKCEKLSITNLAFADDLLLFSRGDPISVDLMVKAFKNFSESTGLIANPSKCKIYFGGVGDDSKRNILNLTGFTEGPLPFRYLGVPLTSKKLSIHHYMPLVDKIVGRINHWSTNLLTYAGRVQLIRSVTFAIANYWMQCFPIPKYVVHKIEAICRSFLWTGGQEIKRKSPVAWDSVCKPKDYGGLNIIDLSVWNKVTMLKLLWNLSGKSDSLWVKWVNAYYLNKDTLMNVSVKIHNSWIMKSILKHRSSILDIQSIWDSMLEKNRFGMKEVYKSLCTNTSKVRWRNLFRGNTARPRALMTLWLACHGRLATKNRLKKFGMIEDSKCCFCPAEESINHLFYGCPELKIIWTKVLDWVQIKRVPREWNDELEWLISSTKGKGKRHAILKLAAAETLYGIWRYRNDKSFGNTVDNTKIADNIIDMIVYRGWYSGYLRDHIANLMMG